MLLKSRLHLARNSSFYTFKLFITNPCLNMLLLKSEIKLLNKIPPILKFDFISTGKILNQG
jgi:hypothetical protein